MPTRIGVLYQKSPPMPEGWNYEWLDATTPGATWGGLPSEDIYMDPNYTECFDVSYDGLHDPLVGWIRVQGYGPLGYSWWSNPTIVPEPTNGLFPAIVLLVLLFKGFRDYNRNRRRSSVV